MNKKKPGRPKGSKNKRAQQATVLSRKGKTTFARDYVKSVEKSLSIITVFEKHGFEVPDEGAFFSLIADLNAIGKTGKRRGRKAAVTSAIESNNVTTLPKKRGRKPKRKRGRPARKVGMDM